MQSGSGPHLSRIGLSIQVSELAGSGGFTVAVSVAMERRNVFAVRAKIPVASEEAAAKAFTQLLADLDGHLYSSLQVVEKV